MQNAADKGRRTSIEVIEKHVARPSERFATIFLASKLGKKDQLRTMGRKSSRRAGISTNPKSKAPPGAQIEKIQNYEDTMEEGGVDDCPCLSLEPLVALS